MKYEPLPNFIPSFEEITKQMEINCKIIMEKITKHADFEIERIKKERTKNEIYKRKY